MKNFNILQLVFLSVIIAFSLVNPITAQNNNSLNCGSIGVTIGSIDEGVNLDFDLAGSTHDPGNGEPIIGTVVNLNFDFGSVASNSTQAYVSFLFRVPFDQLVYLEYPNQVAGLNNSIWMVGLDYDDKEQLINGFYFYKDCFTCSGGVASVLPVGGNGDSECSSAGISISIQEKYLWDASGNVCVPGLNSSPYIIDCLTYVEETKRVTKDMPSAKIYPNPAKNSIFINSNNEKIEDISLFSLDGKQLIQLSGNNNSLKELDITSIPAGIYLLKLEGEEETQIKKIIVQR